MDNSYYQTNLKFLYEAVDKNNTAVYNVDTLLYNYTSSDTFNANISPASFFTKVTDVMLKREDPTDVSNRMNEDDSSTPPQLPTSIAFTDDATVNELRVDVQRDIETYSSRDMMDSIKERLDIVIKKGENNRDFVANAKGDITKSNTIFNEYMRGIIGSTCLKCMWDAAIQVYKEGATEYSSDVLKNAAQIVTTNIASNPGRFKQLFEYVSTVAKESLKNALKNMPQIRTDIMSNFNNSATSFTRPMYYYLRNDIINKLQIPTNILVPLEDNQLIYVKRILTDLYIKTCYPLLHYDFIDGMMMRYAAEGDYVNVRIALLAKVFMTYYFVDYIDKFIFSSDTTLTKESKDRYTEMFRSISTNIISYLTSLNNIDVNSTPGKNVLADIIRSVHDISNQVVQESNDINDIRIHIDDNQKSLRNVIQNNEIIKDSYSAKVIEFWVTVTILFVIVIVCGILLVLNMPQYVFYVTGTVIIAIFLILAVRLIRSFFG